MTSHTLNNDKTIDINAKLSLKEKTAVDVDNEEESDVVKKLRADIAAEQLELLELKAQIEVVNAKLEALAVKSVKRHQAIYEEVAALLPLEKQKTFWVSIKHIHKNNVMVEEDSDNVFTRSKSVPTTTKKTIKSISRCKSDPSRVSEDCANNNITLLGSGSFGCVISKPISNKNYIIKEYIPYHDIDNNDIGKIYINGEKYFNDELDILLKIKKIDPFNYFTVKLKAAFNFYGNIIAKEKHLLKMLKVKNSIINETFFQIILENGGVHLDDDDLDSIPYKKFLKLFERFLQGMIKLNENKLVHGDIKLDNILISKTKINLIDFGQMLSAKDVYNKEYYGRLSYIYPFYPPEFFIASILLKCKNNISKKLDNVLNIMKKKEYFDKTNIPKKIHEFYYSGIKKFIKDIKSRRLTNYDDIFTEKLALQTDIYSLSLIIKEFNNTKKIVFKTKKEYNFLLKLYKRCKDPNPYDRINIYSLYTLVRNEYNIQKTKI
jgi:serine/threonine protein kinase